MKNLLRHIIASVLLLGFFWASVCSLQAQQSGSAPAQQNPKFQPQIVTKSVNVIQPPARGSVTTTLKGTELAPAAKRPGETEDGRGGCRGRGGSQRIRRAVQLRIAV